MTQPSVAPALPGPGSPGAGPLAAGPLGVGLVGAGGFARFVVEAMDDVPGLRLAAVTDLDARRAGELAHPRGARVHVDHHALLADPSVEVVIIATPPAQHAALSVDALDSGHHVFCEKPSGMDPEEVAAVARAVARSGRVYVVDHVVHHNPLVLLLARLRSLGVLGEVQRFSFENDAGDSGLDVGHWFWDQEHSGGILLEHGVHFFDVARFLVGSPEEQVQLMGHTRPDGRVDTVVATVRHANGALATHTHGFSHANPTERQLMRIDTGMAEARLEGWIPLELRLDAWLDEEQLAILQGIVDDGSALAVPGHRPTAHQRIGLEVLAGVHELRTHGATHPGMRHAVLHASLGRPQDKQEVYAASVAGALTDLVRAVREGGVPLTGIDEGAAAVEVAHAGTVAREQELTPVVTCRG